VRARRPGVVSADRRLPMGIHLHRRRPAGAVTRCSANRRIPARVGGVFRSGCGCNCGAVRFFDATDTPSSQKIRRGSTKPLRVRFWPNEQRPLAMRVKHELAGKNRRHGARSSAWSKTSSFDGIEAANADAGVCCHLRSDPASNAALIVAERRRRPAAPLPAPARVTRFPLRSARRSPIYASRR
jgi:hypothetical protein